MHRNIKSQHLLVCLVRTVLGSANMLTLFQVLGLIPAALSASVCICSVLMLCVCWLVCEWSRKRETTEKMCETALRMRSSRV